MLESLEITKTTEDVQYPWLEKLKEKKELQKEDIVSLLEAEGKEQEILFETARKIREEKFGRKTNIRGVIEISNHCVSVCQYCAMRRQSDIPRYRLSKEQIFEIASQIKKTGLKEVFLQSGEDKKMDMVLLEVIREIKENLGLEITLCLGEKNSATYKEFKKAGADGYILKHETSDPKIFKKMKPSTSIERRLACLKKLKRLGFKVGTGTLIGLPEQTIESIAEDLLLAKELEVDMVSISPLVVSKETPLADFEPDKKRFNRALNYIALSRILVPKATIPTVSALEKVKKEIYGENGGQIDGFMAGANNITINFTPIKERKKYVIYNEERFIVTLKYASSTAKEAGLELELNENSIAS